MNKLKKCVLWLLQLLVNTLFITCFIYCDNLQSQEKGDRFAVAVVVLFFTISRGSGRLPVGLLLLCRTPRRRAFNRWPKSPRTRGARWSYRKLMATFCYESRFRLHRVAYAPIKSKIQHPPRPRANPGYLNCVQMPYPMVGFSLSNAPTKEQSSSVPVVYNKGWVYSIRRTRIRLCFSYIPSKIRHSFLKTFFIWANGSQMLYLFLQFIPSRLNACLQLLATSAPEKKKK